MSVPLEDAPSLTGLEQLQALAASGRRPGLLGSLDIDLVEVAEGRVVFEGAPGLHHYNPLGSVHGGYAATMLDSACGCAVQSRLGASQKSATLELKVAYHKPIIAETGPVRAVGRVVTMGRRIAFADASLTDANGRLLASATSTLVVLDN